jgi:hypothetical protein
MNIRKQMIGTILIYIFKHIHMKLNNMSIRDKESVIL